MDQIERMAAERLSIHPFFVASFAPPSGGLRFNSLAKA